MQIKKRGDTSVHSPFFFEIKYVIPIDVILVENYP